jgi:hypothetical protein
LGDAVAVLTAVTLGQDADAAALVEEWLSTLAVEQGIAPSAVTTALVASLLVDVPPALQLAVVQELIASGVPPEAATEGWDVANGGAPPPVPAPPAPPVAPPAAPPAAPRALSPWPVLVTAILFGGFAVWSGQFLTRTTKTKGRRRR